ncbi:hypothetical protein ACIPSJ_01725 [Streptomyces sp. NPDC090088]|uniref:hypothetical protein n=1 Tax=Streptomyces sp. NPDC090088 TaxID=3365944 RepID=UPI0037FE88B1
MELIETTYFGWNALAHAAGCQTPVWDDAEVLREEGIRPLAGSTEPHGCANGDCTHATTFDRLRLRLLCRDCDTVHTISAESLGQALTHTSATGWGQRPRQIGEVWLWPGRPVVPGGEPTQYLVTRQAATVTEATLYGITSRYRDASGTPLWIAAAVPDPDGAHQVSTLRWRYSSNGLAELEDAAAFIADAELPAVRPLVVSV